MKEIIEKAKEYALKEIELNKSPKLEHFELSNKKGQEIAEKLGADKDLVMLGTIFMDLKIGECIKEGKLEEHIDRSSKATQEFLKDFDLDEETFKKIVNCIEAHHGTKEYICKEAEICANADCYRFLHPRGVIGAIILFGARDHNINACLEKVNAKFEEKKGVLSLDVCKEELEQSIKQIENILEKAKEK